MNHDDPADQNQVERLANAMVRVFANANAGRTDVFVALFHVQLSAIVEAAADENEAVEHVERIARHLRANVGAYWKRHLAGELVTRLQ